MTTKLLNFCNQRDYLAVAEISVGDAPVNSTLIPGPEVVTGEYKNRDIIQFDIRIALANGD